MLAEPLKITLLVIDVFIKLNVPYFIGGSLASSMHGIPRSTMDADIIADLHAKDANPFVSLLEQDFYINVDMVKRAIRDRDSFNIIYLTTMFKIDIFILKSDIFSKTEFQRRREEILIHNTSRTVFVSTPEDTILQKLMWFKAGGEVSERQWTDIMNMIKVQGERLDLVYLKKWANELGVIALLEKAY
ncbi:MAG: hypothetical protein V1872_10430 [bacterium]